MTHEGERRPSSLDDVSKAIIAQLQQDGRRSYASIGKAVGLSEEIRAKLADNLGDAFDRVWTLAQQQDLSLRSAALVAAIREVAYVVLTAGSYDLLAEVVCESDEHLLDIISNEIRGIPGVAGTETLVYLKLRKQTYSWGVR